MIPYSSSQSTVARTRSAAPLFLREDGLIVGYLETPDFERARAAMAATDVNACWQAEMAGFIEELDGQAPEAAMRSLTEIFHLA
ncbi:L-rhamnose mutarotase [Streptomyces zaomyceticus]